MSWGLAHLARHVPGCISPLQPIKAFTNILAGVRVVGTLVTVGVSTWSNISRSSSTWSTLSSWKQAIVSPAASKLIAFLISSPVRSARPRMYSDWGGSGARAGAGAGNHYKEHHLRHHHMKPDSVFLRTIQELLLLCSSSLRSLLLNFFLLGLFNCLDL